MKKTNKKKLEEFIRVDHAGERGALKIYEGQLLALNTLVNNDDLKKTMYEMKKHTLVVTYFCLDLVMVFRLIQNFYLIV